jgi:hypothetical protein
VRAGARAVLLVLALAGCAAPTATRLGAQYISSDAPPEALRGAAILVVCNGAERTLELICENQFSAQLTALGTRPLTNAALVSPTPGREAPAGAYIAPAQAAGAHAVLNVTLTPDFSAAAAAPTFSFGIGGFGGSSGSRAVGGGVGVTLPAGTVGSSGSGLAAIASFVDVASGRVLWSTRAVVAPAPDPTAMLAEAARALTAAAVKAGLF